MDKFKNLFTDEEIIDEEEENESIEIKEIKKEEEHKLPTFMREKIEREQQEKEQKMTQKLEVPREEKIEIKELKVEEKVPEPVISKKIEEKSSFKFPMDLSDNDFIETRSRQSIHGGERTRVPLKPKVEVQPKKEVISVASRKEAKVSELYKEKKEEKKEERHFKATPIISPIYGVLDQNYTSGDIEKNKGDNLEHHRHSKNVDFDSVRKKAYGNITKEIKENLMCENCEYLKEAKECKKIKEEDSSNYEVLDVEECRYQSEQENTYSNYDDTIKNYDNITLDEATENYYDYGVAYDKSNYEPQEEDVKIVSHDEVREHPKKEIPPVKSSINLLSTLKKSMGDEENTDSVIKEEKKEKNLELTDDLFNLIDSMYDERNGGK